jgi:hypothetical protein
VPSYQAATSTNVSGFELPDAPAVPLLSIRRDTFGEYVSNIIYFFF